METENPLYEHLNLFVRVQCAHSDFPKQDKLLSRIENIIIIKQHFQVKTYYSYSKTILRHVFKINLTISVVS